MACSRCGNGCSCACSGNPVPSQDWRQQVALQVRAHKVRKRRRLDPDSPLLAFEEQEPLIIAETSTAAVRSSSWRWDEGLLSPPDNSRSECDRTQFRGSTSSNESIEDEELQRPQMEDTSDSLAAAMSERPPVSPAPFPRITNPAPKIIEFPRILSRQYELAEPVADQLRIFEAIEELPPPPPSHLSQIEIAPEVPAHLLLNEIETPIQTAPLEQRAYGAAVDGAVMIGAIGLFGISAEFFATSLPMTKPLLECGAVCIFLLLTIYYVLSFSLGRGTPGMQASGLRVVTFSGDTPSRTILRFRALATVLSHAALGMGFAWLLIDEDRLCWHDRITHTYLTPK